MRKIMIIACAFILALAAALPAQHSRPDAAFTLPWGEDDGAAGLLQGPEIESGGPLSFDVSKNRVLLLDSVKKRVLESGAGGGTRLRRKNVSSFDIRSDERGGFFALAENAVLHYADDKNPPRRFPFPEGLRRIRGYGSSLNLAGDRLLYQDASQKSLPLASRSGGNDYVPAKNPGPESFRGFAAGDDDMRYRIKRLSSSDIRLVGEDASGKITRSVKLEIPGEAPGAVLFKGRDEKGRLYVEMELLKEGRAELEVHAYAPGGGLERRLRLPNDYETTVYTKTRVEPDGSVWQMFTDAEGVHFYRYK